MYRWKITLFLNSKPRHCLMTLFEVHIVSNVLCINVFYLPRGWRVLLEREHVEGLSVDGYIILKWIFKEWGWWHGLDSFG